MPLIIANKMSIGFVENVELKNGELTRNGFIQLNEMEAADNEGDTDDLWVTLNCMGFNKGLQLDEVRHSTIIIHIYTDRFFFNVNI